MAVQNEATTPEEPLFSVVKGSPTEEEIAALTVAVLQTRQRQPEPRSRQTNGPLSDVGRLLSRRQRIGANLPPGPGSWRRAKPR